MIFHFLKMQVLNISNNKSVHRLYNQIIRRKPDKTIKWGNMKKAVLFLVFISIMASGCKDNPSEPVKPDNNSNSGLVTSIKGKLPGWNLGTGYRMMFLVRGTMSEPDTVYSVSEISADGQFTLSNLKMVYSTIFYDPVYWQYYSGIEFIENTFACSDSSARVCLGAFYIAKDTARIPSMEAGNQNFTGMYYSGNYKPKTGDVITEYYYADRDVTATGKITRVYKSETTYTVTRNYDLNFKKGWNRKVTTVNLYDEHKTGDTIFVKIEYTYSTGGEGTADWHIFNVNAGN